MNFAQTTQNWLMAGDPSIQRLTAKYLLEQTISYTEDGYMTTLLAAFDTSKGLWGGGIYSPKWISTHYTLLDLKSLEISSDHPFFQQGLNSILEDYWPLNGTKPKGVGTDLCVLGMAVSLLAYGRHKDIRLEDMVMYLLNHIQADGGWNCAWNRKGNASKKSSLHTTLTVLESFQDYLETGYTLHADAIKTVIPAAQEFIFKKKVYLCETTGLPIHKDFMSAHFPTRWKYDYLRALLYFARVNHPLDSRLQPALNLLKEQLTSGQQPGIMPKSTTYTGKTHLSLEDPGNGGRFNTLRAYRVLKVYDV